MLNNNNNNRKENIALIGAGVAGNGALFEFSKRLRQGDSLTIFESSDEPFKGFPYQQSHTALEHKFLTPSSTLKTFDDHTEPFSYWLSKNKEQVIKKIVDQYKDNTSEAFLKEALQEVREKANDPNYYPPRVVYGYYMEAQASNVIDKMRKNGVNVRVVKKDINSITKLEEGFGINGEKFSKVLVTNGSVPNQVENENHVYSKNVKDKIRNAIIKNGENIKIKIIGSQASAIDILKSTEDVIAKLKEEGRINNNMRVKVDLVSRDAMMQRVKSEVFDYKNEFLNEENFPDALKKNNGDILKTFNELFKRDLELLSKKQLNGIKIDFDLFDFIKKSKDVNGLQLMKEDLKNFQTPEYMAMRTVFTNARYLNYNILDDNRDNQKIQGLHSLLIANIGSIFHEFAEKITNGLENTTLDVKKVQDVVDTEYDLSLDSRTFSKANENSLNNQLMASGMTDKNGDSITKNLLTLGGISHASNRFAMGAYHNGTLAAKCLHENQSNLVLSNLSTLIQKIEVFTKKEPEAVTQEPKAVENEVNFFAKR